MVFRFINQLNLYKRVIFSYATFSFLILIIFIHILSRKHINSESVMFLKALSIKDHLKKKYFQNQKNENETDNLHSNNPETNQNNP